MGALNLTTRLVLFVVFLNSVKAFESIPDGNCSHGFQRDILQEMRQTEPEASEEDAQVVIDFSECAAKWRATVGEPCISEREFGEKLKQMCKIHRGDIPWDEFKPLAGQMCKKDLICSAARECEWKDSTVVSSTCDLSENSRKNFVMNCDKETKALVDLNRRLYMTNRVSNKALIIFFVFMLLAIIFFVVADHYRTHRINSIWQFEIKI